MSPQAYYRWQMPFRNTVKIRFALGLAFLLALLSCSAKEASAQPLFSPAQDPIAGSRVFGGKGCSKCHAIGGVGNKIGPDLGRTSGTRSFYDLAASMWNHLPEMAKQMQKLGISRPQLSPSETGDLIAFLYTLNYFDRPGDAKRGNQLFAKKFCVSCHQLAGTGGVIGPNLDSLAQNGAPIYLSTAMWNHGPAMAAAMKSMNIQRPTFTAAELNDLVAYIRSAKPDVTPERMYVLPGRPDHGQELFSARSCAECHSVKGRGGKIGGELADRKNQLSLVQFAAAIWNKAPAMMKEMNNRNIPVPQLRPDEMADIVAYLYSVQYFARPGDFARGSTLAKTKNCLTCHKTGGEGGDIGPDFKKMEYLDQPVTIVAAMWNHASRMEQKMGKMALDWPRLTGSEMADLVSFIQASAQNRR
ncbi:MAG: c-type cytochrome [Deltaproteobacteria bacterium]